MYLHKRKKPSPLMTCFMILMYLAILVIGFLCMSGIVVANGQPPITPDAYSLQQIAIQARFYGLSGVQDKQSKHDKTCKKRCTATPVPTVLYPTSTGFVCHMPTCQAGYYCVQVCR